jgi:hypothetical protein
MVHFVVRTQATSVGGCRLKLHRTQLGELLILFVGLLAL